jgi:hypothetical protein
VRIEFKSEGGLAHFPGLSGQIAVDTAQMPAGESGQVERLIETAQFFDLPKVLGQPRPGAADYRKYTVTITDGLRSHSVQVYDPIERTALRNLVDFLKTKARRKA